MQSRLVYWLVENINKMDFSHHKLAIFKSDSGITLSFGESIYLISTEDPFYNIAHKALEQKDYVPFYIEIAKREGLGPEFRDSLLQKINELVDQE